MKVYSSKDGSCLLHFCVLAASTGAGRENVHDAQEGALGTNNLGHVPRGEAKQPSKYLFESQALLCIDTLFLPPMLISKISTGSGIVWVR